MPEPIAKWNESRDCWETEQVDLLSGRSTVFSGTFPLSGTTQSGLAFARPTPARLTPGSGSSFLPTPMVSEGRKATMQSVESRADHQVYLTNVIHDLLLPTPNTSSGTGPGEHGMGGPNLQTVLLPTPQVADVTGGHKTRSGSRSNELLLPGVAEALSSGDRTRLPSNGGSESPDE